MGWKDKWMYSWRKETIVGWSLRDGGKGADATRGDVDTYLLTNSA